MHIPDGFLNAEVVGATAALSAAALGYGLRRGACALDERKISLLAATGAFLFAAHMLNFPVASGTSGHFLGAALAAVLLGPWLAMLTVGGVLAIQALVFADGGLSALGANVFNMGVIGALVVGSLMLAARNSLPRSRTVFLSIVAAGAWLAVMAGAAAVSVQLALSGTVPLAEVLPAMLGVHALIGLAEAGITALVVGAVLVTRPDLIAVRDLAPAETADAVEALKGA